jgi:hypothetical protein
MLSLRSILRKADIHFGVALKPSFGVSGDVGTAHADLCALETVHWKLKRFQTIRQTQFATFIWATRP